MNRLEKIQRYIQMTNIKDKKQYEITVGEIEALFQFSRQEIYEALCLTYEYGQAKGYRMALKEVKA